MKQYTLYGVILLIAMSSAAHGEFSVTVLGKNMHRRKGVWLLA